MITEGIGLTGDCGKQEVEERERLAVTERSTQRPGRLGQRRLRDVFGGHAEMSTRHSEVDVEPRSWPTDEACRQGTTVLSGVLVNRTDLWLQK